MQTPITYLQKLEVLHLLIIHSRQYRALVDMPATPSIDAVTNALLADYERHAVESGELTQAHLDALYSGDPLETGEA